MKPAWSSFFTEFIAVVLGIVITFAGQGMIDRAHDRKEVRSALRLVRSELISNRQDLVELRQDILNQMKQSAQYLDDNAELVKNLDRLDSATVRTVKFHQGMVLADVSVNLPHDALELLKMSSLFQKIGDNALSMKIIRAYDCCQVIMESVDRHFEARNAQPVESLPIWILDHDSPIYTDATDIDRAITAINVFLRK